MEIISDKKTKQPESGRLKLLKKIMYNSSCYEFVTLKSFYAACLREIEVGNKTWEDDFSTMEMVICRNVFPKPKVGFSLGKSPSNLIKSLKILLMVPTLKKKCGFVPIFKGTNVCTKAII